MLTFGWWIPIVFHSVNLSLAPTSSHLVTCGGPNYKLASKINEEEEEAEEN